MFRAMLVAAAAVLALIGVPASPAHAAVPGGAAQWADGPTAAALPTPPVNGIVRTGAYYQGVVYFGGRFTAVRPLGSSTWVARHNLVAVDARTGQLLPWAPRPWARTLAVAAGQRPDVTCNVDWGARTQTCDTVYRLAVLGGRLYAAGDFWSMTGPVAAPQRVAAFTLATGQLDPGFRPPTVNRTVRAIAARPGVIYLGGLFSQVGDHPRTALASLNSATGALYDWAPPVDGQVWALAYGAGKVAVGGLFENLAGDRIHALGAVDAARPVAARWDYRALPGRAQIKDLVTDGTDFYAASEGQGRGVFDGQLAITGNTGALRWANDCRGATQAIALRWPEHRTDNHLFTASHTHDCTAVGAFGEQYGWTNRYFRAWSQPTHPAADRPVLDYAFPDMDGGDYDLPADRMPSRQGPETVVVTPYGVWYGGQFEHVNGAYQPGLTRFGWAPGAPSYPPTRPAAPYAVAVPAGARITWKASEDIDTASPTYSVQRSGIIGGPPVWQTVWKGRLDSRIWSRASGWVTHGGAPRGLYRITVSDGTTTVAGPATLYPGN